MPGTRQLPEGVSIEHVIGDRCTQALFLTQDQEQVSYTRVIRDDWKMAGGECCRLEEWWVGETKLRLSDEFPIRRSLDSHIQSVHAIALGASSRLHVCPGDDTMRLPVYWTKDIVAISFPLWDTSAEECDGRSLEQCFLLMPITVGAALLEEEIQPQRRDYYHQLNGELGVTSTGTNPPDVDAEDAWGVVSFRGGYVHLSRCPRVGAALPPSSRGWRFMTCGFP